MLYYFLIHDETRVIKGGISTTPQIAPEGHSVVVKDIPYKLQWRQDINTGIMVAYKIRDGQETVLATEDEISSISSAPKIIDGVKTWWKLDDQNNKIPATDEDVEKAKADPEREAEKYKIKMETHHQAVRDAAENPTQENIQNYFKTKAALL